MAQATSTRDKKVLERVALVAAETYQSIRDARWRLGESIAQAKDNGWSYRAIHARMNEMALNWHDVIGYKLTLKLVITLATNARNVPEGGIIDPRGKREPITREQVDLLGLDPEQTAAATSGEVIRLSELSKAIHKVRAGKEPEKATAKLRDKINPPEPVAKPERESAQEAYDRALAKRNEARVALDKAEAALLEAKRRLDQVNESLSRATMEADATVSAPAEPKPKATTKGKKNKGKGQPRARTAKAERAQSATA